MEKWIRIRTIYKTASIKETNIKMLNDLFPGLSVNRAIEKLLEDHLKNGRVHITI